MADLQLEDGATLQLENGAPLELETPAPPPTGPYTAPTVFGYPAGFPCPTWSYGTDTTPYPLRTQFDNGWTRQRRAFPETGMSANLSFVMTTNMFERWSTWVEANGWNWFRIGLDDGEGTVLQEVRLITPPTWGYDAFDNIVAQITVEVAPDGCREESTSG